MNTHEFRHSLARADLAALGQVIDWLERPAEAHRNDALRAAWHRARRDPGARSALCAAIEQEVLELRPAEARHVARTLGLAAEEPSAGELQRAIAARLFPPFRGEPVRVDLGPVVGPVLELAGRVLRAALREPPVFRSRARGRRRHGRC